MKIKNYCLLFFLMGCLNISGVIISLFGITKPIYIEAELKINELTFNQETEDFECRVFLVGNKTKGEAPQLINQIQKIQTRDGGQEFLYQKENFQVSTTKSLEMIYEKPDCRNDPLALLLKVGNEPILIYLIKIIFPV